MSRAKRLGLAALRWSGPVINAWLAYLNRDDHPLFAALLFAFSFVLAGLMFLTFRREP